MSVFTNPAGRALEEAKAYVAALMELLGDRDPVAVLRDTPSSMGPAIDGLSAQQMRTPERPGKWSIGQVLQHLADSELVVGWRLRLVLAQDRPALTGYDQDVWAQRFHYDEADPADAVETFRVLRRGNMRIIDRASPEDWKRVGVHNERGEESFEHLCRLVAGHDLLHLRQIARIRATLDG